MVILINYAQHILGPGCIKLIEVGRLSDSTLDLAGSQAAGADMHSLLSAVNVHSDFLDVGIPDSVGSSMRMADVISKMSALAADITFCHLKHLLTYIFGSTTFV